MAEFHLAIVGGCMTHQAGIPLNTLYHRQLAREVQEREGIVMRTHIARAHDRDYTGRVDSLLDKGRIDGVLIHVRVMVMKRARLLIGGSSRRLGYSFHPAVLNRTHSGAAVEELRAAELNAPVEPAGRVGLERRYQQRRGAPLGGFRMRDLNTAFGALAGLDRWAVDDELLRLREFVADCSSRSLPVFVLGPTPVSTTRWQARPIRLLNGRLPPFCRTQGIPLSLIEAVRDENQDYILEPDGVHLTVAGHTLVARRLLAGGFGDWVKQSSVRHA